MAGTKYIQLRLTEAEHEMLATAAAATGRSIPTEIMRRLGFFQEVERARALGDLAVIVAERVDKHLGPKDISAFGPKRGGMDKAYRAAFLGAVKASLDKVLDALGAREPDNRDLATAVSFELADRIKDTRPVSAAALELFPEVRALDRIGEAFGFKRTKGTAASREARAIKRKE